MKTGGNGSAKIKVPLIETNRILFAISAIAYFASSEDASAGVETERVAPSTFAFLPTKNLPLALGGTGAVQTNRFGSRPAARMKDLCNQSTWQPVLSQHQSPQQRSAKEVRHN